MNKIKRVLALLLAMAMVLGTTLTAFAAPKEATVTINNAGADAKFKYVQVIEPDTATATGWKFSSDAIQAHYLKAYNSKDAQAVLRIMIANDVASNGTAALKAVLEDNTIVKSAEVTSPFKVYEAGVYAISGTETGYGYSPMAAYVAFSNYDTTTGVPAALTNPVVEAKKAPTEVVKTNNDADNVLEIGRPVTYSVTTTVPYIAAGEVNTSYIATDTISGARYDVNSQGELTVNVKVGDAAPTPYTVKPANNSFTLDLSTLLNGNNNANSTLVISYNAIVTDTIIGNTIVFGDGSNTMRYGKDSDKLITGRVTLTKTGDANARLAGAGFIVRKTENGVVNYATFDSNNKLTGWVTDKTKATEVVTSDSTDVNIRGTLVVQGLDSGVTYEFEEVTAPEGYSINDTASTVTWGEIPANLDTVVDGTTSMVDTKLSALPSTGGIGTTIFTIGGCLIMITAAGLFFASRRKSAKK